ncbi:MAG: hypothetical protein FJ146_03045 [Deltaproteobacteria bacterium]|nr:hypothetical protein [Deltaproteobacteria bacterium]
MKKVCLPLSLFLGVALFTNEIAVAEESVLDGEVPQLPAEADQIVVSPSEAGIGLEQESVEDQPLPVDRSTNDNGRWMFNGGFGASAEYVSGQATLGYYWVRFVGVEATYYYYQLNSEQYFAAQVGPETDLMVRLYNSTMVTPLAGLGVGFTRWHRRYLGERFSEGGSLTANVLFGVDIALSRHFGIQIIRKNTNYLGSIPVSFTDRQRDEARSTWYTNIGFRVMF